MMLVLNASLRSNRTLGNSREKCLIDMNGTMMLMIGGFLDLLYTLIIEAGPRLGWRWRSVDHSNGHSINGACEVNWLDAARHR